MKFAFCTCVQIGLSCMEAIYRVGGKLDLIITLKDEKAKKKSGRVYVDDFAAKHGIPVLKINHVNDAEVIEALKEHQIDWFFIIGWSQIAAAATIHAPNKGAIGAHPTLLPEGRGRAAIPWAIIKGLSKTGVSFFKMDEGVDTGPILGQYEIPLAPAETARALYDKVNQAHVLLIDKIWEDLAADRVEAIVQDESKATYWEGRTPADGELNIGMTVLEVDTLVRATTRPYPGAYLLDNGVKKIIWQGRIVSVIPKKMLDNEWAIQFSNGFYIAEEWEVVSPEIGN